MKRIKSNCASLNRLINIRLAKIWKQCHLPANYRFWRRTSSVLDAQELPIARKIIFCRHILLQRFAEIALIVHARRLSGRLARTVHGRQQQGHEHADDGDDNQKLDQSKTVTSMRVHTRTSYRPGYGCRQSARCHYSITAGRIPAFLVRAGVLAAADAEWHGRQKANRRPERTPVLRTDLPSKSIAASRARGRPQFSLRPSASSAVIQSAGL